MKKKFLIVLTIMLVFLISFEAFLILQKNNTGIAQSKENETIETNEIEDIANINIDLTNVEIEPTEEPNVENNTEVINTDTDNVPVQAEQNQATAPVTSNQNKQEIKKETPKVPVTTKKEETKQVSEQKAQSQEQTQPKQEVKETTNDTLKCTNDKHFMDVGNTHKWFDTKEKAINYYNTLIKELGEKWTNMEITDEEYYSKCPYRYEVWGCLCGKYTLDFYYR